MNKIMSLIAIAIFMLLSSGCSTSLTADIDPSTDLSSLNTFYVEKLPADERNIHELIAARLNAIGKQATAGSEPEPPTGVDAVVTYEDKWMWDMTMYMLELKIDLRDPNTKYKLATAKSYRTSLARKSPEGMVEEVLGKIFGQPPVEE